jgi:dethiobiotin synthetase
MKAVFITATDTGAGKTIISGFLGRYLLDKGYRVATQKWIQTGAKNSADDIDWHRRLMLRKKKDINNYLPYMSPYTFRFASSPHLAASLERRKIEARKIKKSFRTLAEHFDFVIVEGSGGALVPFDKKKLIIDIARELDLPVLIVAANRLGAINHTLLTVEALKKRNTKIIGIIFNNQSKGANKIILEDNPRIIGMLTAEKILGILPRLADKASLYKRFIPIGRRVLSCLKKR